MTKLDILMKRWKEGVPMNPDLLLCLKVIDNLTRALHEERNRKPTNKQGINREAGESNNTGTQRSKTKGLRAWFQGGSDGTSEQNKDSL